MKLQPYIQYILKYYRQNQTKLFVSVLCLTICYLALEIVISFGSVIENNSQATFQKYFDEASFIISSPSGIKFDKDGQLVSNTSLDTSLLNDFTNHFKANDFSFVKASNEPENKNISFIIVKNKSLHSKLITYCKSKEIKVLSSFYLENSNENKQTLMYDVNGVGNRFNLFTFENQISAFILGSELSSNVGFISRLISLFAIVFTFYISLLYFQERKNEFSTLIVQGYTDKNLTIIFIDCIIQNAIAFALSVLSLTILLYFLTTGSDFSNALSGVFYILPYLPVLIIIQLLLLFNRSINYATTF